MDHIRRCKNCLISETFPGVKYNEDGVCNHCEKYEQSGNENNLIQANRERIEEIIKERKGKSLYDVIVAYSGGKDSSYILFYLKKVHNLNILALLIDNDFVSEQALKNARTLTGKLGIDLIILRPDASFMHKMYYKSINTELYNLTQLTRANAACLTCINLINNLTLNEAIIRRIPIIAGGYIGGQIPSEAGIIKTDGRLFNDFREKNKKFLALEIDEKFNHYLHISPIAEGQLYPVIINPLLGLNYNENEIIKTIFGYGWEKPSNTGKSSSNCLLNDYAIAVHYEKYKFHSYEAEICLQVRNGTMSKEEALSKLIDIKPPESFKDIIKKLNH